MSDYIYMLENHLSADQNRVVQEVQAAAGQANVNVFLTGGAMRDMLAGFRIRDLDFVVEGPALKVAKTVCDRTNAEITTSDDNRKSAELLFPSGVTAQIAMSRQEKYARTGAKPQVSAATIQEDLRGRDFTCNAVALSLNRASRGLLLDPLNGLADIERRELRAASAYGFYDDPSRLLRLIRLRVRLGFTIEARTEMQVANAHEAGVEKMIPPRAFADELRRISVEDTPSEMMKGLDEAGVLELFVPAVTGAKLNLPGLEKLEKLAHLLPDEAKNRAARLGPFLWVLTEKLNAKEKQAVLKAVELSTVDAAAYQKLDARSKKLETALRSARIRKPSQVYHIVNAAEPDEILLTLYRSALKPVQERLRGYFQKYLPAVQEITPEEWATIEGKPGTPKYQKARDQFVTNRLDRRPPKKPSEDEEEPAAPASTPAPVPEPALARRR
jgi:tRNA nucleotidyltransferase (CCA-adding enzyme)